MSSHARVSPPVWASGQTLGPKHAGYLFLFERLSCAFGLTVADILVFWAGQQLFGQNSGAQEITISREGGLHPVIFHASLYWLLAAGFVVLRGVMGDYTARRLFWDGVKGTTAGLVIVSIPDLAIALPSEAAAELHHLSCWIFVVAGVPAARQCARVILSLGNVWKIPTAVIGLEKTASDLHANLGRSLALGLDIRWAIVEGGDDHIGKGLGAAVRIPLGDRPERTVPALVNGGCREAIIALNGIKSSDASLLLRRLQESGVSVAILPIGSLLPSVGARVNGSFGTGVVVPSWTSSAQQAPSRIIKRFFDIVASIFLLAILSPLFLVIAGAIKRADGGPATYAHIRVGRNGILFPCLKFRTMVTDAESKLAEWQISNPELHDEFLQSFKLKDDPRITPIGKWLRLTSLDELPQLFNVLWGQMSLVGPRPVIVRELDEYYGSTASLYLRVRPGLTGLWQISGRNETGYDQRVLLDECYILNWSFWGDIVILIQTVWVVLSAEGAL